MAVFTIRVTSLDDMRGAMVGSLVRAADEQRKSATRARTKRDARAAMHAADALYLLAAFWREARIELVPEMPKRETISNIVEF